MKVEQIYTGCLAEAAYYIESNGEAAIIDPLRETAPYILKAAETGAKIKYVFETHFHADFVSGHLDLAKETGATIVYGPTAQPNFEAYVAKDNEVLKVGDVSIVVLHTPGHTMESSTFLLRDETGKDVAVFTGDTLFIGDVGRPDLAVKTNLTREDLASHLYDSIQNKYMPLADEIIVYPGHGAGSACGKNLAKETTDTLGNQKRTNYAMRPGITREEFIKEVTDGLLPPPQYFPKNAVMNKMGYESIDTVMKRAANPLSAAAFEAAANETGALVLDTRDPNVFGAGFIPNSINIGVDGTFAPWVGALIHDLKQPLLIVAEPGKEEEVVIRLSRVGYDNCIGYLDGGFETWKKAGKDIETIATLSTEEFVAAFNKGGVKVFDVRKPGEYEAGHLSGVENTPLDYLNDYMSHFHREEPFYIHCAGGYRSMIAASILKARGFNNVMDVAGGFNAIVATGLEVVKGTQVTA